MIHVSLSPWSRIELHEDRSRHLGETVPAPSKSSPSRPGGADLVLDDLSVGPECYGHEGRHQPTQPLAGKSMRVLDRCGTATGLFPLR